MAKQIKKTPTEQWLAEMAVKYPLAVEHFLSFLTRWDIPTLGAVFSQLQVQELYAPIELYLKSNGAPDAARSIDPIKSSLEFAFRKSQEIADACLPGVYNIPVSKHIEMKPAALAA